MKRKASRTLTATASRMSPAATGLTAIVRMAEIVAGAADGRAAAGGIADAAGAGDGLVVVVDGIADVAGLVGDDTNFFATDWHGFTRIREKGHGVSRGLFLSVAEIFGDACYFSVMCRV